MMSSREAVSGWPAVRLVDHAIETIDLAEQIVERTDGDGIGDTRLDDSRLRSGSSWQPPQKRALARQLPEIHTGSF